MTGQQPLFSKKSSGKGIIAGLQRTWSEGAHDTEIRGGLTSFQPKEYSGSDEDQLYVWYERKENPPCLLVKSQSCLKSFKKNTASLGRRGLYHPHQASRALPLVMEKLGVAEDQYLNRHWLWKYGVSLYPFGLAYSLEHGLIRREMSSTLWGLQLVWRSICWLWNCNNHLNTERSGTWASARLPSTPELRYTSRNISSSRC